MVQKSKDGVQNSIKSIIISGTYRHHSKNATSPILRKSVKFAKNNNAGIKFIDLGSNNVNNIKNFRVRVL